MPHFEPARLVLSDCITPTWPTSPAKTSSSKWAPAMPFTACWPTPATCVGVSHRSRLDAALFRELGVWHWPSQPVRIQALLEPKSGGAHYSDGNNLVRWFAAKGSEMFGFFKKPAQPEESDPAREHFRKCEPDPTREYFRACNVYCKPDADQVIVAAVYNHGGLMAEKPGHAAIVKFSDLAKLQAAVLAALDACEYEENFNYSDHKRSDWPAYQASGYKTIKRFEAEFIRLLVKGVNEKNLYYDVTTPEFGDLGLHLTVTVNAYGGHYGEAVHYIVKNYLACRVVAS